MGWGRPANWAGAEYERVMAADPATLKPPVRLSGLSPWSAVSGSGASAD